MSMPLTRSGDRPLRVAIMSTCAVGTPPKRYGGTELVVAELACALAQLGHRPSVFATGDSTCVGVRPGPFPEPVWPPDPLAELRHCGEAWSQIAKEDFDVVHLNHAGAVPFTRLVRRPTVATIHHDRLTEASRHYEAYPDVSYVAISRRQAELAWEVPIRAVIHHGLDVSLYPEGRGDGGYCAYLGRFAAEKGTHLAIQAARAAGTPLRLAGEAHPSERAYFAQHVAPELGEDTRWVGELDLPRKTALLGAARALLFPIQWEEPFGLVMIESMLVGTPVIALACGSAPEVVEDGVTGFLVATVEQMAERIGHLGAIDRHRCRARARERWSSQRMAAGYVDVYRDAIEAFRRAPRARQLLARESDGALPFARAR